MNAKERLVERIKRFRSEYGYEPERDDELISVILQEFEKTPH